MQLEGLGGIKRGDRADTGDEQARPTEGANSLDASDLATLGDSDDLEDLTIHDAGDPELGLTDVGDLGPDDWAADTGPTQSGEAGSHGVSSELVDDDLDADGRRIEFDRS